MREHACRWVLAAILVPGLNAFAAEKIFTDTWLLTGMFDSNKEEISYVISPLKEIKKDPKTPGGVAEGAFEVGGDFVGFLEPKGKTHLAWIAYDWWVIYHRAG